MSQVRVFRHFVIFVVCDARAIAFRLVCFHFGRAKFHCEDTHQLLGEGQGSVFEFFA